MKNNKGNYIDTILRRGKSIVSTITIIYIILAIGGFLFMFFGGERGFFYFLVALFFIVVAIKLYSGKRWAKWVLIIIGLLNIFSLIGYISSVAIPTIKYLSIDVPSLVLLAVFIISYIFSIVSAFILYFSKAVEEFMYSQDDSNSRIFFNKI